MGWCEMTKLFYGIPGAVGKKLGVVLDARASLQGNKGTGGSIRLEGILAEIFGEERVKFTDAKVRFGQYDQILSSEVYIPVDRIILLYVPEDE